MKTSSGRSNASFSESPTSNMTCPHKHFRAKLIDRDQLDPKDHIALLATPRGYRWNGSFPPNYKGPKSFSLLKPARKKNQDDQKTLQEAEQRYMHQFVSQIFPLMSSEMLLRLKRMLIVEFGMTPKKADDFISKQRKLGYTSQPKLIKEIDKNAKSFWLKEFERMLTSKITDYIVSLMCARRSERTEKIAESVLSHICDITGEKCNLDDPQNDIQRLQVFLAERFAVWLANLLVNADEVLCEELTKHKVKVERKSEELRRWSSLKPERPSASELKKQRELEKEKRKEEKRQKKLEEEEKRREEERQKKLEEEERQKSLEEEERQKSLEEEEKQKEEGNQNKLKEDEEGKEKREEEEKLEEEEGMNKEEESKQELEEEESRKKEEMERSSEPEKEKPLDETLESQEEEDQDKKSSDLEKADEDEIKATENEKIEAEDILDEVEKESEEGKTGDQEEVVDEIIVGEGEITGEVSREEMVEEELKESERDEEITVGGEEKVAEEESVGEEEGETSDEGLLEDYALEKSEEDHIPAEEEGGDHPSDSEGLKDEEEEIKPEIETAEPLSIVEEWIEETTPVESDQQKAISELLEKEVVKSMGDVTPEEAEAMKEVIKKTSSLVDQLTTEAKGQLEGQTMEILPSPPLPFPKQRQTTIYLIKKDAEGCFYKVQQIEQKKVCDLTKVARTRRVGLMPESICKRPKNEKPLKNFTELKDWAKWAADVVNFAEKWASWISNTSMEAKKRIEDQEIKTNWVKFKGKAEMHAIELLRNKKYVKQTSKAWKEKLSKIN